MCLQESWEHKKKKKNRKSMSIDLILKPSCTGCGSTVELYGSTCKHLTLCVNCGKSMAEKRSKCHECGTPVTRLIRVRSFFTSEKDLLIFFINDVM